MPYELSVEEEAGLVVVRFTGGLDLRDIVAALHEMSGRDLRHYHQLWDLTSATAMLIEPDDFVQFDAMVASRRQHLGDRGGRVAAAARDDVFYAISKVVQHRAKRDGIDVEVFHRLAEARAWLLKA